MDYIKFFEIPVQPRFCCNIFSDVFWENGTQRYNLLLSRKFLNISTLKDFNCREGYIKITNNTINVVFIFYLKKIKETALSLDKCVVHNFEHDHSI